eukprot:763778-Hanusia_phi.AAC.10
MAAMNEVADILPETVLLDYVRSQIPSNAHLWSFRKHLAVQYACQVLLCSDASAAHECVGLGVARAVYSSSSSFQARAQPAPGRRHAPWIHAWLEQGVHENAGRHRHGAFQNDPDADDSAVACGLGRRLLCRHGSSGHGAQPSQSAASASPVHSAQGGVARLQQPNAQARTERRAVGDGSWSLGVGSCQRVCASGDMSGSLRVGADWICAGVSASQRLVAHDGPRGREGPQRRRPRDAHQRQGYLTDHGGCRPREADRDAKLVASLGVSETSACT